MGSLFACIAWWFICTEETKKNWNWGGTGRAKVGDRVLNIPRRFCVWGSDCSVVLVCGAAECINLYLLGLLLV